MLHLLDHVLTADAAAKHGHEYSPPPQPSAQTNGSYFPQMPLSLLGSVLRKQPASPAPAPSEPEEGPPTASPATPLSTSQHRHLHNGHAPIPKLVTAELDCTPASSPSHSRPASLSSTASQDGRPRKRAHRPKTTFNLAQPPPASHPRSKLHLRPKVLLQLHQVVPGRRPKPVYEVIPFSLLAPRSTRRLARTFNSKDRLCPTDLLIVKAEPYDNSHEEERTDDERWGSREVLGIICPGKKVDRDQCDKTEVLLDDGSSWEVTRMANGGYEFSYTDDHGLTLKRRWIPKGPHLRRISTMSNSSQTLPSPMAGPEEKKFNFSTISPLRRRHPVIASMSRASIDVLDTYVMPSATSPPTPGPSHSNFSTPLPTPASIDATSFLEKDDERLRVHTDDGLRTFIVLSGIWVALSENWSPAYSGPQSIAHPSPLTTSMTSRPTPNRAVSMSFLDSPRSVSPASTIDENRRTIPRLFRAGTQRLQSSTSFTSSGPSPAANKAFPPSSPASKIKTRSRRSNSTGNADLISKSHSHRKRFGLPFEDQSLPETEEERQTKRSNEVLRIKEMALSTAATTPSSPPPNLNSVPVQIIEPPAEVQSPPSPSPTARERKTQSTYNPVTTAGLWDSGVVEGPKLKSRPTSLVVLNSKKEKAKRKQEKEREKERERTKGKENGKDKEREKDKGRLDGPAEKEKSGGGGLKRFLSVFRRKDKDKDKDKR